MIYLFLADGFEELEAITIIDIIRRSNIEITTVSIGKELMVNSAHGVSIKADKLFENVDFSDAKGIILPGGALGTTNLENHEGLKKLILELNQDNKFIMAICAAPSVLGKYGVLNNKKATCYPGFESELKGANIQTDKVVVDGNLITSRGPGTAIDFALKIVEIFDSKATVSNLKDSMIL